MLLSGFFIFKEMVLQRTNRYFMLIVSILLAVISTISPFAIDGMSPAIPTIAKDLGVEVNHMELMVTFYLLGLTIGQFLGGPLSDSFGRIKVLITGIAIYSISSFTIPHCDSLELIWGLRTLQAVGGGFSVVINVAIIRDLFKDNEIAQVVSLVGTISMIAPLIAPTLGTFVLTHFGWRAIFSSLSVYSLIVLIIFISIIPESRDRKLITNRLTPKQLVHSYKLFFKNRKAVWFILSTSFISAGLFSYITVSPTIFMEYYNFSPETYTKMFLALICVNVILSIANVKIVKRVGPEMMAKIGITMFVTGSVFIFTATLLGSDFTYIYTGLMIYIGSLGVMFANIVSLIIKMFKRVAGAANAVIGVTRFLFSAIVGTITSLAYDGTLIPMGIVLLICGIGTAVTFYIAIKLPEPPNCEG